MTPKIIDRLQNTSCKLLFVGCSFSFTTFNIFEPLINEGPEYDDLDLFEKLINNKLTNDATKVFADQWEAHFNRRSI